MTDNICSGNIAKNRLKNVLYMDRTKDLIDNNLLELMKHDIAKVVSKYISISEKNINLKILSQNNNSNDFNTILNAEIYIDNFLSCIRKDKNDTKKN